MSEYTYVEKTFLDQLAALGWEVIDHGEGVPGDPTISYRTTFREVTLKSVFKQSVKAINTTDDGQEWLTDQQLDDLHDELLNPPGKSLVEINQNLLHFRERYIMGRLFSSFILGLFPGIFGEEFDNGTTW